MTVPAGILDRVLGAPMSAAHPNGLLTAEDYAAARRQGLLGLGTGLLAASGPSTMNLNQRLAAGIQSGQEQYQGALNAQAQRAQQGQQFDLNNMRLDAGRADIAAQQRLAAGRQAILAKYPTPQTQDPNAIITWLDQVIPEFAALGDTDTLRSLTEVRKSLGGASEAGAVVDTVDEQGNPVKRWFSREQLRAGVPKYVAPDKGLSEYQQDRLLQSRLAAEDRLYDDFFRATNKAATATMVIQDTVRDKERALAGDIAAQIRVLYGFINSMDNTAVREGELRIVQAASPLLDRAVQLASKLSITGEAQAIPREMLSQMIGLMDRRLASNRRFLEQQTRVFQNAARRRGADPERFRVDLLEGDALTGGAPPPRMEGESIDDYVARTRGGSQ